MSVKNFKISFAGEAEVVTPRLGRLHSTDTLAVVTAAGYLDVYLKSSGFSLRATDLVAVVASDGSQWYKPVFTAGSCRLTALP